MHRPRHSHGLNILSPHSSHDLILLPFLACDSNVLVPDVCNSNCNVPTEEKKKKKKKKTR